MGFYFVRVMELYYEVVFAMHAVNAKHRIQRNVYQEEPGSVRFVSVTDFSTIDRFSSVRFGKFIFPVRRGSACAFRMRRGSVRFGSVRFRVRFRLVPKLSGSVWFGSVSYSFLDYFNSIPPTSQQLFEHPLFRRRRRRPCGEAGFGPDIIIILVIIIIISMIMYSYILYYTMN